jgi:hypothetical protein
VSLPEWLVAKLRAENPDGVTRGARLGTCERCRRPVLRGLDDDRCAMAVEADPFEVDRFGEYLALARGLRTFHLARRFNSAGAARWEIDPRTQWSIAVERKRYPVIPQHRCGVILPAIANGMLAKLKPTSAEYDGPPPF